MGRRPPNNSHSNSNNKTKPPSQSGPNPTPNMQEFPPRLELLITNRTRFQFELQGFNEVIMLVTRPDDEQMLFRCYLNQVLIYSATHPAGPGTVVTVEFPPEILQQIRSAKLTSPQSAPAPSPTPTIASTPAPASAPEPASVSTPAPEPAPAPAPVREAMPENAEETTTNSANAAHPEPQSPICDLQQPARERVTYDQYLEDRAKHLGELNATYQSWQLNEKFGSQTSHTRFKLAMIYLNNSHPSYPANAETALKYIQLASAQGHDEASAYIALFHLAGIVFPQSAAVAYSILHSRIEAGCAPSMFWLSTIHLYGPKAAIESSTLRNVLPQQTLDTNSFNPDNVEFVPNNEQALQLLHQAGDLGYDRAQDLLSWLYFTGYWVDEPSFDDAIRWANEFSHSAGQKCFENNDGVSLHLRDALAYIDSVDQVDDAELAQLLQPACDEGSPHAWYLSGLIHARLSSTVLRSLGDFCFLQAAVRGSPEGLYKFGFYQLSQSTADRKLAAHCIELAATRGDRDALYYLGRMYQDGYHFAKNINQAFELKLKAAQLGDFYAQWHVADMYEFGKGVLKSLRDAANWYTKVANFSVDSLADATKHVSPQQLSTYTRGIPTLQRRIGQIYLHGDPATGFPPCPITALKYLQLGTEGTQHVDHQVELWRLLSTVSTTSSLPPELRDDTAAVKWITLSAHQNHVDSQLFMARHLYNGLGVKHDVHAAVAWWRKALDLGSSTAAYKLGNFHYHGEHPHIVPKDKEEGIRLLTLAAEEGHQDAQMDLGMIYRRSGANSQAEKWYTAVAKTSARGKVALAIFYQKTPNYTPPTMTEEEIDLKIVSLYSDAAKDKVSSSTANISLASIFFQGFRSIPENFDKTSSCLVSCLDDDPSTKDAPSAVALLASYVFGVFLNRGFCHTKLKTSLGFTTPLEWWTFGATHGGAECQYALAQLYYEGSHGLEQDYALASHWLHQCLKQCHHNPNAISLLGKMQHRGVFVRPPESEEDE